MTPGAVNIDVRLFNRLVSTFSTNSQYRLQSPVPIEEDITKRNRICFPAVQLPANSSSSHKFCFPSIIIGCCPKSGTGAVVRFLKAKSEFDGPNFELGYFGTKRESAVGPTWYLSRMPALEHNSSVIVVEKTPHYFYRTDSPRNAVENIRALLPSAALVSVLREPVKRAYSMFWQNVETGKYGQSRRFSRAEEGRLYLSTLEKEFYEKLQKGTCEPVLKNSMYGIYFASALKTLNAVSFETTRSVLSAESFNPRSMLLVSGDEIFEDLSSVLNSVSRFAGVRLDVPYASSDFELGDRNRYCYRRGLDDLYCLPTSKGRVYPAIPKKMENFLSALYSRSNEDVRGMLPKGSEYFYSRWSFADHSSIDNIEEMMTACGYP